MTQASALACVAALFKFAARGGAPFVNAAGGLDAHLTRQSGAARWRVIGTTHAAHRGSEFLA